MLTLQQFHLDNCKLIHAEHKSMARQNAIQNGVLADYEEWAALLAVHEEGVLGTIKTLHSTSPDCAWEWADRHGMLDQYIEWCMGPASGGYEEEIKAAKAESDMQKLADLFYFDDAEFVMEGDGGMYAFSVTNIMDEVKWFYGWVRNGRPYISAENCLEDIENVLDNPRVIAWHSPSYAERAALVGV